MENTQQLQTSLTPEIVSLSPGKKNSSLLLLVGVVTVITAVLAGGLGYYLGSMQRVQPIVENIQPEQKVQVSSIPQTGDIACTMEAKLCPDGSSVGRTGPNCEFTQCPNPIETKDLYQGKYFSVSNSSKWKFISDTNQSPNTPEVLETVAFANDQARLNIQVGSQSEQEVLDSQDGESGGKASVDGTSFTKKSGYGGIAGSVYSVSVVGSANGKTYLINYYTQDSKNIESYNRDFDELLSTFKLK